MNKQIYNNDELQILTEKWSEARGITINGNVKTQFCKLVSEIGELGDNIAKGKDIKDDIGDALVVLTNIAVLAGTDLNDCWNVAYEDIKDRKGILNEEGNFIKSTDPVYEETCKRIQSNKNGDISIVVKHIAQEYNEEFNTNKINILYSNGTKTHILSDVLSINDLIKYIGTSRNTFEKAFEDLL